MPRPPKQPLSAKAYAIISLCGLVAAVSTFIYFNRAIADQHRSDQLYYIVLLISGLGAGSFLFGTMRSYAVYVGKHLPGTIELGGPIIAAILVIYGGFKLVPAPEAEFNIKVQLKNVDGPSTDISGSLIWIKNTDLKQKKMDAADMVADFIDIPAKYLNRKMQFGMNFPGYELAYPDSGYLLNQDAFVVLPVRRDNTLAEIRGNIIDEDGNALNGVIVQLSASNVADTTEANGVFVLSIAPNLRQDSVGLFCFKKGYESKLVTAYPSSGQRPIYKLMRSSK
jgi:hypothetical protein